MIKHIVMWKLKDHAAGATKQVNAQKARQLLEDLKNTVPSVGTIEAGINLAEGEAAFDLSLYSTFETWEALESYQAHEAHLKVAEFIAEIRTDRVVVDYES